MPLTDIRQVDGRLRQPSEMLLYVEDGGGYT